jgi:hypothetical protein
VPLPVQRLRGERELDGDRTLLAADLVRWFQLLCFEGYWQGARPKALRRASSTHLGDSSHRHGAGSSASLTAGRPPRISSGLTDGSSSSPERSRSALLGPRSTHHAPRLVDGRRHARFGAKRRCQKAPGTTSMDRHRLIWLDRALETRLNGSRE